jgi:hypothetical protein
MESTHSVEAPVYLICHWSTVSWDGAWKPYLWRAEYTNGESIEIERFPSGRHVVTADGKCHGWSNTLDGAQRKAIKVRGAGAFRRVQ